MKGHPVIPNVVMRLARVMMMKTNGQACIEAVLLGFVPQPQPAKIHQQALK